MPQESLYEQKKLHDNSKELSRNSHGNCENNTGKRRMRSVWNMATTASGGVTHYAKFPNELAERRNRACRYNHIRQSLPRYVDSGKKSRVETR